MNNEDLLDQQIENYLHNRMDTHERIVFEQMLSTNETLKKDIETLAELLALYNTNLFALKQKLDTTENELQKEQFFDEGGEG